MYCVFSRLSHQGTIFSEKFLLLLLYTRINSRPTMKRKAPQAVTICVCVTHFSENGTLRKVMVNFRNPYLYKLLFTNLTLSYFPRGCTCKCATMDEPPLRIRSHSLVLIMRWIHRLRLPASDFYFRLVFSHPSAPDQSRT